MELLDKKQSNNCIHTHSWIWTIRKQFDWQAICPIITLILSASITDQHFARQTNQSDKPGVVK